MIKAFLLSRLKQILIGASVGLTLAVPSCAYQYGVGIKCSESLSSCEISTGYEDKEKSLPPGQE